MAKKKTAKAHVYPDAFPVYVKLKSPNPYGGKVRVCGIEVTDSEIEVKDAKTLAKLRPVQAFLEITTAKEPVKMEAVTLEEVPVEENQNEENE